MGSSPHLEPVPELPRITGQDLLEVAEAKKSTAGGLGGLGMSSKLCRLLGFQAWLFC